MNPPNVNEEQSAMESTVRTTHALTVGEMAAYLRTLDPDAVLIEIVPEGYVTERGGYGLTGEMRVVTRP